MAIRQKCQLSMKILLFNNKTRRHQSVKGSSSCSTKPETQYSYDAQQYRCAINTASLRCVIAQLRGVATQMGWAYIVAHAQSSHSSVYDFTPAYMYMQFYFPFPDSNFSQRVPFELQLGITSPRRLRQYGLLTCDLRWHNLVRKFQNAHKLKK